MIISNQSLHNFRLLRKDKIKINIVFKQTTWCISIGNNLPKQARLRRGLLEPIL